MSRVFVAGATGVLGRRVVPALVAAGYCVTANTRNEEARARAEQAGAETRTVDLLDPAATAQLGDEYDAVVNMATAIPTGGSSARKRAWVMNDRLRTEASANLAAAMAAIGGRYVGESVTFPYLDAGDGWIDESQPRSYLPSEESCRSSEHAALTVTEAGGHGVSLRFSMFFATDSAHVHELRSVARAGVFGIPGRGDSYMSWLHVDDAAGAVVSALDAPDGVYNVAEPDPTTWADHARALGRSVGRKRLRLVPPKFARLGGPALASLTRSQRISSRKLTDATGWTPQHAVVTCW